MPAPAASYAAPVPVAEYIAPAPVENVASAPAVATEVPTVRFRLQDEWLHAERVLRARAARRWYFFSELKKRDCSATGAQLLSHGTACEVARGSPVASLLVPVAILEYVVVFQVAGL